VIETVTTKQLSSILGISVQRVNELGRKGKIQRESDGGWDLVKVNASLRRNLDKHQAIRSLGQTAQANMSPLEGGEGEGETFSEAQRRNEWLKVQKSELELALRREELLEKAQAKEEWGKLLTAFKNKLLYLPGKVARKITPITDDRKCRSLIEHEIKEALSILSEYEPDAV
jgi:hypothetical protein